MPWFEADRVRRESPDLARVDTPLVLTRRVGSSKLIERVDGTADRLGIHAGMTVGQAHALAPALVSADFDPPRDQATLIQLARWALRFSPTVEPIEPNTIFVDITGCQQLFGGEQSIAQQAIGGLLRQGFQARVAIADTPGAAYACAAGGDAAMTVIPLDKTESHLAPLPPLSLRIEHSVCEQLSKLGVRTIGQLLKLPRSTLPARFGALTVKRLRQAMGEEPEPLAAQSDDTPPIAQVAFEDELTDGATMLFVLGQLLDELIAEIESRDLALLALECILIYEHASPTVFRVELSRASRAWKHVKTLACQRLDSLVLVEGVIGLRLVAIRTERWRGRQADLFTRQEPGDDEAVGCLIDRLVNRLGADAVSRAVMVDDHQPEVAFRYLAAAEQGLGELKPDSTDPPPISTPRPMRVLSKPDPIRVIALVPDGPPTWCATRDSEYTIACAWGPERIETAWWRGPDVRRDYFRVLTESGDQFWVYHEPDTTRWFLHGVFV